MKFKIGFIAILLFWAISTVSCQQQPYGRSMGYGDHMMGYYGFGGILMWLIILVLVGIVVYFLIAYNKQSGFAGRGPTETPLDILKKRFARGEISKEEFEQLKKDIQ